jgi:hypothetical protein
MELVGANPGWIFRIFESLRNAVRPSVDITINNQHPKMKLEYPIRFIRGGACTNAPTDEICPEASTTIHLAGDTTSLQFKGALLYKLMPSESEIKISNSIYLALFWKVTALRGFYVHMTLIEHDNHLAFLGRDLVKNHYYRTFRHKLRELNESISCSWSLDENIPFTINMTANYNQFGELNVKIKEGRSNASNSKPINIELVE